MDFNEILSQVLDLLRREGRASYRALKLRFQVERPMHFGLVINLQTAQALGLTMPLRVPTGG